MQFLIKIPSRQRPEKLVNLIKKLNELQSGKNDIRILVSCDMDDVSMIDIDLTRFKNVTAFFGSRTTKIEAANRDIEKISFNWDILVALDDDMMPIEKEYDAVIANSMNKHFPDGDGALWFYDGHQPNFLTYAVMGKKYYDRFGYIYHPAYKGFYCDNEFMHVAQKLNRLAQPNWPLCIIEHQHYAFSNDTSKNRLNGADDLYRQNFSTFQQDHDTFVKRRSQNFGL